MTDVIAMKNWSERVLRVVGPRGPYPHEYPATALALIWLRRRVANYKAVVKELLIDPHEAWQKIPVLPAQDIETRPYFNFLLHIWYQPRGYAGDGDLLTKFYRALDTPDLDLGGGPMNPWVFSRWDSFIASRPEVLAISARKDYVVTMAQFCADLGMTSWLDVACGTGEFTKQVIMEQGDRIDRVCGIDNDPMSIDIAQRRMASKTGLVDYQEMNILTDLPKEEYDVVYCTGLFDYLDDDLFIKTAKRFLTLKPRCIMIGNIQQTADTKAIMECFGWEICDRSAFDLISLAGQILPGAPCDIETDRTGLQHFLRINVDKEGVDG